MNNLFYPRYLLLMIISNYIAMMDYYRKNCLINKIDLLLPPSNLPSLYVGNTGVTNIDVILQELANTNYLHQISERNNMQYT
jgi:hypothetical protein